METQRPYASYLPDPMKFVAENNGITTQQLRDIFTKSAGLMVVAVGFFVALPIALPIDPRQRIQCPKMNPSRVHTPEGQVGWGGSCMALYNVESPGGYMNTGLSIPSADVLGFKHMYSPDRPWLFDDFDQITFYEVDEDKYEELMAVFRSGRYEYEYEDTEFDMGEHNRLLQSTKDEVEAMKEKQKAAQQEMLKKEKELLEKWNKEREEGKISVDDVEELLNDPNIIQIQSPLNANVWKLPIITATTTTQEGSTSTTATRITEPQQTIAVLEAMKLEVPVTTDEGMKGCTVEKVLVREGDVVDAGSVLVLLRKGKGKE